MWTRCIQRQSCKIKIRNFFHKTNTMKANRGYRPPAFNNRGPGSANRGSGSGPADRSGPGPLMTEHLQLQVVHTCYMSNIDLLVRLENIFGVFAT